MWSERLSFYIPLLDGSKDHHLYKDAGSSLTVACSFGSSGKTKYFCRGGCEEEENILVYTDGVRAQSGRYSIGHSKHKSSDVFYVTIKNLTQSDSGRYRCLSNTQINTPCGHSYTMHVYPTVSSETTGPSPLDQNYRATSTGTSVQCQLKTFPPADHCFLADLCLPIFKSLT
uniref:Immunoglobulin V-set domain-containing protein n=1 Tax=Poecilia latipinna TaxID=48699 RepID=A0A3B3TKD6_9TELE